LNNVQLLARFKMSKDIEVDIKELKSFIDVLKGFQDKATDEFKTLKSDWSKCDETWKGDAKDEFTDGFEETEQALERSIEAGDDSIRWLEKFYEILLEFDRN